MLSLQLNNKNYKLMNNKIILSCLLLAALTSRAQQKMGLEYLTREPNTEVLKQKIQTLGHGTEQDRWLLMNYYESRKDMMRADSVLQATVGFYPLGRLAYIQLANKIVSESDVVKKEQIAAKILRDFPDADKNRIHHSLAYGYASVKNIPKVVENINALSTPGAKSSATMIVAKLIMNYNLPAAESLIRTQIDEVLKAGVPAPPPREGDTGQHGNARPAYFMFLELYTNILVKMGKYDEALKYAKQVYVENKGRKDEFTATYGLILSKTGDHKDAVPLLETLIADGKGNTEMKAAFKFSFAKLNPGKDPSAYLAQLERGMKGKIEAEVAKMLINIDAPNFSLKDANGKIVSLADFKGKTIVLDFWATWCMPCIGSFPAMQIAVDMYKADPNVKFLFIHTWERTEDPLTDAKSFLANNNYKFDLYIDARDIKTKANPAITAFGARGIPAKFVIDAAGKIRFKVNGFSGGNEAAAAELSAMIEMSKNVNSN